MSPEPLTVRQKEILDYIVAFQKREGVSPTHREICEEFGYSSYGTVHKHLRLLREKGYLDRKWNQKQRTRAAPWSSSPSWTLTSTRG